MMRILVITDDLTGAGEIAGIAGHHGLQVRIWTGDTIAMPDPGDGLTIINTDTRNMGREEAVAKVSQSLVHCDPGSFELVYKKTDSLLRGQGPPEILAVMEWEGSSSALLVPANPSRGRLIRDGTYFINNIPLNETEFRQDPEFPCQSAALADLLKIEGSELITHPVNWSERSGSVVVPDVHSMEDIHEIVNTRISGEELLAGGADFFNDLLATRVHDQMKEPLCQITYPPARIFLLGSYAEANRTDSERLKHSGYSICQLSEGKEQSRNRGVTDRLSADGAFFSSDKLVLKFPDDYISSAEKRESLLEEITALTVTLAKERQKAVHFLVTGGRTASAFCRKMEWNELHFLHSVERGICSFRSPGSSHILTIKPGSYHWPASFVS